MVAQFVHICAVSATDKYGVREPCRVCAARSRFDRPRCGAQPDEGNSLLRVRPLCQQRRSTIVAARPRGRRQQASVPRRPGTRRGSSPMCTIVATVARERPPESVPEWRRLSALTRPAGGSAHIAAPSGIIGKKSAITAPEQCLPLRSKNMPLDCRIQRPATRAMPMA